MKVKVYLACPYTYPDPAINVNKAIQVANKLVDKGYVPHIPILYHLWHLITPRSYATWMRLDHEWLKVCDYAVRIPGKSKGADRDIQVAKQYGVKVISLNDLLRK